MLAPEFNDAINSMVAVAGDYSENGGNGYLNLQLMGVEDIPSQVVRMGKKCRKLRLDYNDHCRISNIHPDMQGEHSFAY